LKHERVKVKNYWKALVNELRDTLGVTSTIASFMLYAIVLLPSCFILAYTVPIWILPPMITLWIWILIVSSPFIYGVVQRIRHEDSLVRIMTEAWETSGKPVEERVQEYKDMLEKGKKDK
jgi:hypothetical protein